MEKIIRALKLQHDIIESLRDALNKVSPEPKDIPKLFSNVDKVYADALFECGKLAATGKE